MEGEITLILRDLSILFSKKNGNKKRGRRSRKGIGGSKKRR
jgi:hypothetical protein